MVVYELISGTFLRRPNRDDLAHYQRFLGPWDPGTLGPWDPVHVIIRARAQSTVLTVRFLQPRNLGTNAKSQR